MDNDDKKDDSKWYLKYIFMVMGFVVLYILMKNPYTRSLLLEVVDEEKLLKKYGIIGIIVYILIGIVLNVVLFLYFFVNLTTGFIFGFKRGLLISMTIVIISATISFLISRYFIKEKIPKNNETFKKISEHQTNFNLYDWIKYNVVTRVTPIPFNIVSYFWGTTEIDIWVYIIATFIGVIPWMVFEVYTGSIVKNINKYV
jgi:uncharacterized membrane protein YdjX (TVP38/TMEM64 family)